MAVPGGRGNPCLHAQNQSRQQHREHSLVVSELRLARVYSRKNLLVAYLSRAHMHLCAFGIRNGSVCCAVACGACGGTGCSKRPEGRQHCCTPPIVQRGRPCSGPADVACMLTEAGSGARPDRSCYLGVRDPRGTVCCPATCGTCRDSGCLRKTGGRHCCPARLRQNGRLCDDPNDSACVVSDRPSALSAGVAAARCETTAYATLLTMHSGNTTTSTFLSTLSNCHRHASCAPRRRLLSLVLVLLRSLRQVERCRPHRDFLVLLGASVHLPWGERRVLLSPGGVKILRVAPRLPGVPSADKLAAWTATQYSLILFLDADIMWTSRATPPDILFERLAQAPQMLYLGAPHTHDLVQAGCGLPLERRLVGAMGLLRPSIATHDALRALASSMSAHHLQHYSEQSAVACHFANASLVLPCSTLFDASSPFGQRGSRRLLNTSRRWCYKMGKPNMRLAWPTRPKPLANSWATFARCDEAARHRERCDVFPSPQALAGI